jgi:hypothetical protein
MRIIVGFDPLDSWTGEEKEEYDQTESVQRYVDECYAAILAVYPDAEFHKILPYYCKAQILDWDDIPEWEDICEHIEEIRSNVFHGYAWLVESSD